MMKSHGRENHSEWFANDCYKKCISVEEVLQEDWLYKLNLLVTNEKAIIAEKYGKVME